MYTNFGAELMATAKEYPVKIRKIPVLDKKVHLGSPWNAALTFKKKY